MKTFKLVGLKIERKEQEGRIEEIPFADGLIINKEDGENSWLIEALLSKRYRYYFELNAQHESELRLFVTISKKSNTPAQIIAKVKSITTLEDHISVLLEGRMYNLRAAKFDAEKILNDLIATGLSGNELLDSFKKKLYKPDSNSKA
ncbi:YwpF-like family protein [Bacillus sp. FJAT-47783]|uniref:YwpF-like family protein n=1 Tax=Bacillus sp. FJAT-47783 TaxID=2922712 RepID=UPI001FAC963C